MNKKDPGSKQDKILERKINSGNTMLEALKKMDSIDKKLLLVFDGNDYTGVLSVGDIQRAIISNHDLATEVGTIVRKNLRVASPSDTAEEVHSMMMEYRTEFMPVVGLNGELIDVIFWEDIFAGEIPAKKRVLDLPVVIMAGGEGRRLKPLTNIIPKPLIPVKDKTILEQIMSRFALIGCDRFYLSVNYKAEILRHYLETINHPYQINYIHEEKPLGTAGSLFLLKGIIDSSFFVSNCDILIDQDLGDIYDYHRERKNELTIVAALKHIPIPYGTIETGDSGQLIRLQEKPEKTYMINSGVYLLEPHLLDEIPQNEFFNLTDLIQRVLDRQGRIGVFPVSQKSWTDIGDWAEFLKLSEITRDEDLNSW